MAEGFSLLSDGRTARLMADVIKTDTKQWPDPQKNKDIQVELFFNNDQNGFIFISGTAGIM